MVAARHTLSFPAIGRVATALIARGAPALIAAPASAADAGVLPVQGWVGAWLHPVAWGPDAPDLDPSVGQDLGDHPHVCAVLLLVLLRELFIRDVDARVELARVILDVAVPVTEPFHIRLPALVLERCQALDLLG